MTARRRSWIKAYATLEEGMGMLLPLLAVASLVPELVSYQSVAFMSLWLGAGHTLLFYFGLYPTLRYRPFFKGLFGFGAGVCWPLWFVKDSPQRR